MAQPLSAKGGHSAPSPIDIDHLCCFITEKQTCIVLSETKLLSIFYRGLKNPDILVKEGIDLI